jgi:hypothetical protein
MTMIDAKVLSEIIHERAAQDAEWGGAAHDDTHGPGEWLEYISHQLDQADAAASFPDEVAWSVRDRLIKIAALSVAAIESIDRVTARNADLSSDFKGD